MKNTFLRWYSISSLKSQALTESSREIMVHFLNHHFKVIRAEYTAVCFYSMVSAILG